MPSAFSSLTYVSSIIGNAPDVANSGDTTGYTKVWFESRLTCNLSALGITTRYTQRQKCPMQNIENDIFEDYKWQFWVEADQLTELRRTKMTQEEIAFKLGVSPKTIQRFEQCKCLDYYLIFGYKRVLLGA